MSKIKTLLTNGTCGRFKNGQIFACLLIGKSKYLRIGTSISPIEEWNLTTYQHQSNEEFDIIKMYKPTNDLFFSHFLISKDSNHQFDFPEDEWSIVFNAEQLIDKSTESNEQESIEDLTKIRTSITIEINNKPVDLNNLSGFERNVLISLGII